MGTQTGCAQTRLGHERTPGTDARDQPDNDRRCVGPRRGLEGLRSNDDTNPKDDGHARVHGHGPSDIRQGTGEKHHAEKGSIEQRIAGAGTQSLPTGVADVDRGGKARAEQGGGHGPEAIGHERRLGWVFVPSSSCRLDVLKRPHQVEQAHRQYDGEVGPALTVTERFPQIGDHRDRHVQRYGRIRTDANRRQAEAPGEGGSEQDGDQAARQSTLETYATKIGQAYDPERDEAHDRPCKGSVHEPERNERQPDAGQRGQQRGPGSEAAQTLGHHTSPEFDEPGAQAGDQPRVPSHPSRIRRARCFGH